jgi:hypothetical protein
LSPAGRETVVWGIAVVFNEREEVIGEGDLDLGRRGRAASMSCKLTGFARFLPRLERKKKQSTL